MKTAPTLAAVFIALVAAANVVAADPPAKPQFTPPDRVIEVPAGEVECFAISPDGKCLAAASGVWRPKARDSQDNVELQLFDVETGKEVRKFHGHTDYIRSIVFSPDGKQLVTASKDMSVRIWDVATGKQVAGFVTHTRDMFGAVASVATFVGDGKTIAICCDKSVFFLDVESGQQARRAVVHRSTIRALAISPNGRHLMTGTGYLNFVKWGPRNLVPVDCRVHLWDVSTGQQIGSSLAFESPVESVAFSADGKLALSGGGHRRVSFNYDESFDCTVRLWDVEKMTVIRVFEGHRDSVESVAFSPDGKFAVSGSEDHTARVWELATGKERQCIALDRTGVPYSFHCMFRQMMWSPDGKFITASGDDRTIRFWRISNPK